MEMVDEKRQYQAGENRGKDSLGGVIGCPEAIIVHKSNDLRRLEYKK